jgi:thiol-disulfide isomerase/thioredoxin
MRGIVLFLIFFIGVASAQIQTFKEVEGEVCTKDGKPVIRLFSTTWCPHCKWIRDTYDRVVMEYVEGGKIVAHHWELDLGDDTFTPEKENGVPQSELAIFKKFNPRGSIPTFVFGCKYYRIGNGYERENDLAKEEAEFRAVIEELISESPRKQPGFEVVLGIVALLVAYLRRKG